MYCCNWKFVLRLNEIKTLCKESNFLLYKCKHLSFYPKNSCREGGSSIFTGFAITFAMASKIRCYLFGTVKVHT